MKKIILSGLLALSAIPVHLSANPQSPIEIKTTIVADTNKNGIFGEEERWNFHKEIKFILESDNPDVIFNYGNFSQDNDPVSNGIIDIPSGNLMAIKIQPKSPFIKKDVKIEFDKPICMDIESLPEGVSIENNLITRGRNCDIATIHTNINSLFLERLMYENDLPKYDNFFRERNISPIIIEIPESYQKGDIINITLTHEDKIETHTINITGQSSLQLHNDIQKIVESSSIIANQDFTLDLSKITNLIGKKYIFDIPKDAENIKKRNDTTVTFVKPQKGILTTRICDASNIPDDSINSLDLVEHFIP